MEANMLQVNLRQLALLVGLIAMGASCQVAPIASPEENQGTIYYQAGTSIWSTKLADGQTLLLADEVPDSRLYLSPDQKWLSYIVYIVEGEERTMSLWIVSAQGDSPPLQVSPEMRMLESNWLRSGLLLYTEYPDFRVDPDTGRPEWGSGTTYTFDPETGTRRLAPQLQPRLTDHSRCGAFLTPAGYDDMAEACAQPDNGFLRVVGIDGSHPITIAASYPGEVEWSGDGEELAFTGYDVDGKWQLAVWDRHDGNVRQIARADARGGYDFGDLSWSPDKQWIAYNGGGNDLCVIKVEDGQVTCFRGYVSAVGTKPAWSPDSRAIVLSSNRIGELLMGDTDLVWDLFVVRIPEGNVTRITNTPEMESWPVWGH